MTQTAPPDERLEWEAADGTYYCPGCGTRYETAGTCEGSSESPHAPIAVEKVAAKGKGKDDAETDGK